jgi:selenocysteine lyase/cysteine desulfurase
MCSHQLSDRARGLSLRLTPGPLHSKEELERFVAALSEVWGKVAKRKVA